MALSRPLLLTSISVGVIALFAPSLLQLPLVLSFVILSSLAYLLLSTNRASARVPQGLALHRRRQALRPLRFTTPSAWSAVLTRQTWETTSTQTLSPSLSRTHPPLAKRFDRLFQLVRQSFILPWYSRLSPSPAFPDAIEVLLRETLLGLGRRAESVDWPSVVVSKLSPIVAGHMKHYRQVEHLNAHGFAAALPLPLPDKPHPALALGHGHSPDAEIETHLRDLVGRLLARAVPERDGSKVVLALAREIVLGAVLMPVFDMLCDGDFWNRQIDEKGGRYLHEQNQVSKFLSALSSLPQPSTSPSTPAKAKSRHSTTTSISANSSTRQFDAFLKSIPKLRTLGEARRLRADVEREQRLAGADLAKEVAGGDEERVKRGRKYVKRLERARIEIDARLAVLAKQQGGGVQEGNLSAVTNPAMASSVNLYTVLSDPSSLAYWLEHMDRRGRSRLVQFWLTVEGFKDPLEAAGQDLALENTMDSSSTPLPSTTSTAQQTLAEDVAFLHQSYFAENAAGTASSTSPCVFDIPQRHLKVIRDFAESSPGEEIDAGQIRRVKHAVFAAQKAVYEEMAEEDWEAFKKSELFLKAVSDLTRSAALLPRPSSPVALREGRSPVTPSAPRLPPALPPRTNTAPLPLTRTTSEMRSPRQASSRQLPTLSSGSIVPSSTSLTPLSPSLSVTLPDLHQPASSRKVSNDSATDRLSLSTPSLMSPNPPSAPRRSSHLDFLISGSADAGGETPLEERGKLFGDDEVDEDEERRQGEEEEKTRMEAIQAALDEIIASDDRPSRDEQSPGESPGMVQSLVLPPRDEDKEKGKLVKAARSVDDLKSSTATKTPRHGSTSAPGSRFPSRGDESGLFRKASMPKLREKPGDLLFEDEELDGSDLDGGGDEPDAADDSTDNLVNMVTAMPSNVDLPAEIARLQEKIEELVKQEHLLATLIRQAELTGSSSELRILRRSLVAVRRDERTAIFQKAQYEQREEEERLVPGRTRITLPKEGVSVELDGGDTGKQVVRYEVDVKQGGGDDAGGALSETRWSVRRRYNEFWELDKSLREWAAALKDDGRAMEDLKWRVTELPGKKLVPSLSASSIETRRAGLERYLQSLLASMVLCDAPPLRAFLSRSLAGTSALPISSDAAAASTLAPHNLVKSLYKTMATSLDDARVGSSMLDLMYSTVSRQLNDVAEGVGGIVGFGPDELAGFLPHALRASSAEMQSRVVGPQGPGSLSPAAVGGESGVGGSFTAPICDLFVEVFDLKERDWLRKQAIVVILQQFLGGTIERRVRDSFKAATAPEALERHLAGFEEILWPGGVRRPPSEARTEQEKLDSRISASRKLALLIPDVAANMIGRSNARRAARRVFGALQDRRLNQQLILCIFDEIFSALLHDPSK